MKPVILEQLLAMAPQRTPEEALRKLREDVEQAWEVMEALNPDDLQDSEPISCEQARLRLGLVEQVLCAVLAKAGENVVGPEIDSVRFATRLTQSMAAALPKGGEMPGAVLYFMLSPPRTILFEQFFNPARPTAAEDELSVQ